MFWDVTTFSPGLQQQIRETAVRESNARYAFDDRVGKLHPAIMAEWQRGTARGSPVAVSGAAVIPHRGVMTFTSTPGKSTKNPELTFYTWDVAIADVMSAADPQFGVSVQVPPTCTLVYPAPGRSNRVDTRLRNGDGVNEVQEYLKRATANREPYPRYSLHFFFDCRGRSS